MIALRRLRPSVVWNRPHLPDGLAVCEVEVLGHGDHGLADVVPSMPWPWPTKKDKAKHGERIEV